MIDSLENVLVVLFTLPNDNQLITVLIINLTETLKY